MTDRPFGRTPLIGCIADDFTGATDLAGLLARAGMRVVQRFGMDPQAGSNAEASLFTRYDAIVVALKTRAVPPPQAIADATTARQWLQSLGIARFFFKYCSTFDSTDRGNIGPVSESLMKQLTVAQTVFCPAFPENGRTVYQGHLFVGDQLLNQSGMQDHPINPMTDANLVSVLRRQSSANVGLLDLHRIERGKEAINESLSAAPPLVIADTVADRHLRQLAEALVDHPLLTGGSAFAGQLAFVLRDRGDFEPTSDNPKWHKLDGPAAIIAGSCSQATQTQVAHFRQRHPALQINVEDLEAKEPTIERIKRWIDSKWEQQPLLIYSTTDADSLAAIQNRLGRQHAAEATEDLLSRVGAYLVESGVKRLIVAGGETAGAVVRHLGIEAVEIGPEIVPGVPWTRSITTPHLDLALKSGNFGGEAFFQQALDV